MIKCVWIEIRPVLKCCNFCVVLNERVSSGIKMKVKKTNLQLDINGELFNVNFKNFTVEPLTITAFRLSNHLLSFRAQTESDFKFKKLSQPKLVPPSFGKSKTSIRCQCDNPVSNEVLFERVLPLPSNGFCFSDMFCHYPNDLEPLKTTPQLNDCLYSDSVIAINEDNVVGCSKKGKFLKCKRCLNTIGVSDNAAKFWNICIKLPFGNMALSEYFKHLIIKAVTDPVSVFPKILLECEENETYLSMVVVDKNLIIASCKEDLILKNMEVVKLKYKFHSSCDAEVKSFKEDPFHSLHHIEVHKSVLDFSTKYLISCSKAIPSILSRMENENLAYVNLCE